MKTIHSKTVKNVSFDIAPKQYGKYKVLAYLNKDKHDDINIIGRFRLNTLDEIRLIESYLKAVDWSLPYEEITASKEHFAVYSFVNKQFN